MNRVIAKLAHFGIERDEAEKLVAHGLGTPRKIKAATIKEIKGCGLSDAKAKVVRAKVKR
jgi:hypothetical protein